MLSKKSRLLISLLVIGSSIFTGCANTNTVEKSSAVKQTFTAWEKKEVVWPEWAAPTTVEIDEDLKYATFQLRSSLNLESAHDNIKQLRYLIENTKPSDETPSYYYWMYNLGDSLLKVGEYKLAYNYLTKIIDLPEDTIVSEVIKDGKIVKNTKKDLNLDSNAKIMILKILAIEGYDEEFNAKNKDIEYTSPINVSAMAFAFGDLGKKEDAYKTFEFASNPDNFKDKNKLKTATSNVGSAAYAFLNGDYDKVLQLTDKISKEGVDSRNPAYFEGFKDNDDYAMKQWKASLGQVNAYRDLAEKAQNGQIADLKNLKDGEYEGSAISFMQSPVSVKVTVKDGKVSNVKANQATPQDDRSNGAFDIIADRIVEKQSIDVDTISGATLSSEAVRIGTLQALLKSK